MKAKIFVIGFVAVLLGAVAASVYFNLTATRPEKSITAVASPDGRYKAVRVSLARGNACFDTISIFLSIYPDSFAETEKTYQVYAAPCATSSGRVPPPEMRWLSNTELRITYSPPPAADRGKVKKQPLDASKYVHVTYVERR